MNMDLVAATSSSYEKQLQQYYIPYIFNHITYNISIFIPGFPAVFYTVVEVILLKWIYFYKIYDHIVDVMELLIGLVNHIAMFALLPS